MVRRHLRLRLRCGRDSGAYRGGVICRGPDSGSMSIAASEVLGSTNDLATITLLRVDTGTVPGPAEVGDIFYMSTAGVMGTAVVQ